MATALELRVISELDILVTAPGEDISDEGLIACDELCIIQLAAMEELIPVDELTIAAELEELIIADEAAVEEDDHELLALLDDVKNIAEIVLDGTVLELKVFELIWLKETTVDELCKLEELDKVCTVDVLDDVLETMMPATKPEPPAVNVAEAVLKKHIPPLV